MATLNINTNNVDPHYRYKMPKLLAKIEGSGNGIKTVVVNMVEVAKALNRPPEYTTKFFGCELGAQVQMDSKNGKYIVNGAHNVNTFQELLDKFIKKFVLCPSCANPETYMKIVGKKGNITARCIACGWRGDFDSTHKVARYMAQNPPGPEYQLGKPSKDDKKDKKGAKVEKKDKKDKKKEKESPHSSKSNSARSSRNRDDDDEVTAEPEPAMQDWSLDVDEESVRQRRLDLEEGLGEGIKGMTLTEADYLDMSEKERLEAFTAFAADPAHTPKEILDEAKRLDVRETGMAVLAAARLGTEPLAGIQKNRLLLALFCHECVGAQRCLLGATERLLATVCPQLLPLMPKVLHAYYDADILDEEVIMQWASQTASKFINSDQFQKLQTAAEPFVTWLMEADVDSDGDESDDEVAFTHGPGPVPVGKAPDNGALSSLEARGFTVAPRAAQNPTLVSAANEAEDNSDLDIDDI